MRLAAGRFLMKLRIMSALAVLALSTACGKTETPKADAAAQAVAVDPAVAAEAARQAEQKAAFNAALAADDTSRLGDLADNGNGFALYHRGQARMTSEINYEREQAFKDIEKASDAGNAEGQLWVGYRMSQGIEGYAWKPNSGLKLVEKAALQGNVEAMFVLGGIYLQDAPMKDEAKGKAWLQKAADAGSDGAKEQLMEMGVIPTPGTPDDGSLEHH
jgi:TPR repeat protein